jgi:hypothetical protein
LSSRLPSKNIKIMLSKIIILPVLLHGSETWSLALRKEQRPRMFKNRVLRRIFGQKRDQIDRLCSLVVRVPGYRSRGPGFDSRRYKFFWEVGGLERGPLSLVNTTEELLGIKSSGSGLQSRKYGRRDVLRWPRGTLYPQKLALTSPTSGGRSVGIVRSRTQATEFSFYVREIKWQEVGTVIVKDRPVLSSERVADIYEPSTLWK